jgi:hypothetical protein
MCVRALANAGEVLLFLIGSERDLLRKALRTYVSHDTNRNTREMSVTEGVTTRAVRVIYM